MAARLVVRDFLSITNADIELSTLTVVIGPSASGKSVLSKLAFFFNELFNEQWQVVEESKGLDHFKAHVKEKFKEWFPVQAWGAGKFQLEFYAGDFQVRISRIEYRKKLGENMRVWFSPYFEEQYDAALAMAKQISKISDDAVESHRAMAVSYEFRENIRKLNRKRLGDNFSESQIFIPAGRSFFTSIGKSIVAFEHGRILDPLILRFGRFYSGLRERRFMPPLSRASSNLASKLDALMNGTLVIERNKEYLKTTDGRRIPLSAMSSGQQELMPLMVALKSRIGYAERYELRQQIFIEEPEAHLFPSAQSSLVEVLSQFIALSKGRSRLMVTTHSPYVLAKINNLIKARDVAGRRGSRRHSEIQEIVKEEYWLDGAKVHAYAIQAGAVTRIQDEDDGMIEADYLDDVSGQIASEFSRILGVEYSR